MYWVHSIVSYLWEEGIKIWEGNTIIYSHNLACRISRDYRGNIDLLKVSCLIYCLHYIFICHWNMLSNTVSLFSCMLLWALTSLYFVGLRFFLDNFQVVQGILAMLLYLSTSKSCQYLLDGEGPHWCH